MSPADIQHRRTGATAVLVRIAMHHRISTGIGIVRVATGPKRVDGKSYSI